MKLRDFGADIELPEPSSDDWLVFEQKTLPTPPAAFEASECFINVGWRSSHAMWGCPEVHLVAPKPCLRGLGLLLLAHAFHQHHRQIRVGVSASSVHGADPTRPKPREIRIDIEGYRRDEEPSPGRVQYSPIRYSYGPRVPAKHPWIHELPADVHDLPWVGVGNDDGFEPKPDEETYVYGFGTLAATFRMAELLLDVSSAENDQDEFELEGEAGFRGVAPASAELGIHLPGSIGYECWAHGDGE